jgi:SAM-dependent methyltransferase
MDMWLFYEATHSRHAYLNPISEAAVREMESHLGLGPGVRVLDIAHGHAEMLIGFAERHGTSGVGVDASPYAYPRSEERRKARVPDADIELIHGRGEDYEPAEPFDVAMCIGASWIWNGFSGTLDALRGFVKPGGLIVSAEPYWRAEPAAEYLAREELERETFFTLDGCYDVAMSKGLELIWMRGSTEQEWDGYEMRQAAAVDEFARENPDHPDLAKIRERHRRCRESYLRWGRSCFGFAFWVFRV